MRVLHLVNEVVDTGNGIVNVTVDLAIELALRGDHVVVASAGGGYTGLLAEHGVRHVTIDFRRRPWSAVRALTRLIREVRPEIVHAHTVAPCVLAAAVRRIPGAPTFHLVASMHNVYQHSAALMGSADMTIGVAESVSETVRSLRWHSPRVETVVNGVVGSPRRKAGSAYADLDLGPRSIVTVGAVSHRKGADVLFDAFRALAPTRPDVHLWYVGNVDWEELAERIRNSDLADRVHLDGLSPAPGLHLAAATVVAVASRREGLALSLLEAREEGAAIVATDTDGAREGLDEGRAGVLVPVDDAAELADALAAVLDDPAHRDALRERSAADLDRFSVRRMAGDYRGWYDDLLGTSPGGRRR